MMKVYLPFAILFFFLFSCNYSSKQDLKAEQESLHKTAEKIDRDFAIIRNEVGSLALKIQKLYESRPNKPLKPAKDLYHLAPNGVFYKTRDDGGSAICVTGVYPVNEEIKQIVYLTEPIDTEFVRIVKQYPEVVQVYYNDKHSCNRIYPFFDVLSQYEAKMDIPSYNFYYMADEKHNPKRKAVWVNEPYVDPAGRGWMVSAIAPVYVTNKLVGVPGIDVTINEIAKRYLPQHSSSMTLIMDNTGTVVTAQESAINFLSFPPLFDHKYIETIKQNTYRKELYNLTLSKEEWVRDLAKQILRNEKHVVETKQKGKNITVLADHIHELDWYLVKILK